jgi:DNA-binding NtrC family response regulator
MSNTAEILFFDAEEELISQIPVEPKLANQIVTLIVEDDPVLLELLTRQAENFSKNVLGFQSAEHAQLYLNNSQTVFDVAIVDYFLPKDNGSTLVKNLKKNNKDGKIYLMTGDLQKITKKEQKGFNDKFQKPLSMKDIYKIFDN